MLRKAIKAADKTVDVFVVILCLLFFLICTYAMIDAVMVYYSANNKDVLKYKPTLENTEPLRELGEDAVAWLTVDGTQIDYPIMQGKTNEEYLNKDPFGEHSLAGSIFLDSRNARDFSDIYNVVYGHHMEYGKMFGSLDEFKKAQFFDTHTTGTLITVAGGNYKITFFACGTALATDKIVFNTDVENNAALLRQLKREAFIYKDTVADAGAHIIALSTCQSAQNVERLILFGILEKI
ncbi:MAG: class B sortase [Clostridia bacterium]|nr:class B sortase [Clostridia bacterium]